MITQRGERLKVPIDEVMRGSIYSGVEGVRLGLADAIGGGTDAIEKAAGLANISGYGIVDVNTEVSRLFNENWQRVNEPLQRGGALPSLADQRALAAALATQSGPSEEPGGRGIFTGGTDAPVLRSLPLPGGIGEDPRTALPDFPMKINGPNAYYLYVGPSP